MEFGLDKVQKLSGIQNNTTAYFSDQEFYCESKESYKIKKKKLNKQTKFNSFKELEFILFSDQETDKYNQLTNKAAHNAADKVGGIATKLTGDAIARVAVKKKTGWFPNYRTRKARRAYSQNFGRKYGASINQLAHMGADYAHEKYLKE
jgi:hypothetical protein